MKTNSRSSFYRYLTLFLFIGTFISCNSDHEIELSNLKCEYLRNPIGVDILQPRFSWNIFSDSRGVAQSAYRIIIGEQKDALINGKISIWDTGKTPSDKLTNIVYDGTPLESDHTYYWTVCIWDQDGAQSSWSKPAIFHTGLLNASDWQAKWITPIDSTLEAPLLRKEFNIEKQVKSAYVYVTGLGYYELYLNGEKVGDHVLDPSLTDYRKRVLYSTYDITEQVKNGINVTGILLGNGAWRLRKVEDRYSWGNGSLISGTLRCLMQMNIIYTDGSQKSIITDNSWKSSDSPITFNNLYGGEDYDARLEKKGWSSAGFDASEWQPVQIAESPGGILKSQLMPSIKVTETIQPIAITNPEPGVYLFDMGQNFAGWWKIRVKGSTGVTLRVRGAETLNDSLFPEPLKQGDHLSIKDAFHARVWTDYTLKGKDLEEYEPRFFYTGFRYVEVILDNKINPEFLEVEGRVVHTALEFNGEFVTSDSLLNRVHRATVWSQRGNTHGSPTDCPHREKGSYTGDGQVIAEASIHDFQMATFYTKWLDDMRDAQEKNGRIPNTAPTLIGGMGGGIAWGSAYILIPWWMYQYYDDTRILEEHYVTMKQYLGYLHNLARIDSDPGEEYIINDFDSYWYSLGEWCAPGQGDCPNHPMVNTYYYYQNSLLLSRIASLLGKNSDAGRYLALADTIKIEMNNKFFNSETNLYGTDTLYQTYQLLALAGDIIPVEHREKVFQTLVDDIVDTKKGHLNTGIIGTKHLWNVLADFNRNDLGYSIATQTTYPSYGFWIEKGATTLWEKWEGIHSHNHQMFGSVDEYFYKYLAGISSPAEGKTTPGYKHIHIQPYVPEGLSFVEASVNTAAGKIESKWNHIPGMFQIRVVIPANSDATISIPILDYKNISVTENDKIIWEDGSFISGTEGIIEGKLEGSFFICSTGSGTYDFKISGN
jgi:alpha-L-rhamnosidase